MKLSTYQTLLPHPIPAVGGNFRRRVLASAAAFLVGSGAAIASPCFSQEAEPAAERIQQWIADLDAAQFGKRQAASQRLIQAGPLAIPQLMEAARHPSREVSERALDVLEQHYRHGDQKLKEAAGESLKKLAGPEEAPVATDRVARAARSVLRPEQDPNSPIIARAIAPAMIQARVNAAVRRPLVAGNIRIAPGGIRANGGIARSISVSEIDGNKKVQISENDRKVNIDLPRKGPVTLELTETKDGKSTTRKFEAKDLNELKQKHPEAFKVYEEFSPMFRGMLIIPPAPGPALPAAPAPALPATPPAAAPAAPAANP